MEFENIIVDSSHIFNNENYTIKKVIHRKQIYIVEENGTHQLFYLIKKGEKYIPNTKNLFINYLERSFDLIHPSIINLAGYSVEKPYLYYQYCQEPLNILDTTLSDENAQKIFLKLASGLYYLLLKGYNFSNLSIDWLILDSEFNPKLINYIDFEQKISNYESDLVIKYTDLLQKIIKNKIEENSVILHNEELKSLFDRCQQKKNIPTFNDFINVFKSISTHDDFEDKKKLDKNQLFNSDTSDDLHEISVYRDFDSIEQVYDYFYNKKLTSLDNDDLYILNSLPESYIKSLVNISPVLSNKLIRYLYDEDMSLIIPDWKIICDSNSKNPFRIYTVIIEKMKQLISVSHSSNDDLDYQIEALRIKAILFLKEAVKNSTDAKINIELAVQYIKGDILPYNLNKALKTLDQISNVTDQKTKKLIEKMKERIRALIKSTSINKYLGVDQRKILEEAAHNDVLSLLYAGFVYYTGLNEFPISRSLSIQYYRVAASKSPDAMAFLGYLYFNGIFFPRNLKRARNCFRRAADNGSLKAGIIDCLIRKHVWRSYLADFGVNDLFNNDYIQSFIPNDSLTLSKIIYWIENNLNSNINYTLKLIRKDDLLKSGDENSMGLEISESIEWNKKYKPIYSEKIIFNHENIEGIKDANQHLFVAKSFFDGVNNFPVNYTKAAEFFKLAADNGNSEAQWRYSLMLINSVGVKYDFYSAYNYLQKSSQNDLKGKFYLALFVKKYNNDLITFENLIKECCDAEDVEAMYQYAMYLETKEDTLNESINYYKKASRKGHFNSVIRLINLFKKQSQDDLYINLIEFSICMFNESILLKLIDFYDKNRKYDKSNILIQIGISINKEMFNVYYINHLLYGKGTIINKKRAKKLAIQGFQKNKNKYVCLVLQALVVSNEHKKALKFLFQNYTIFDEGNRKQFHLFYRKFNESLARKNLIPAFFYYKKFRYCHMLLMDYRLKIENFISLFSNLINNAKLFNNPFAFAIIGKIYKSGKLVIRDLNIAIKYFAQSVKLGCPLGCYYLGKEYFYGRYLRVNYLNAKKYLLLAVKDEPRAGYYLYKILKNIPNNYCSDDNDGDIDDDDDDDDDIDVDDENNVNCIVMLKIGVKFGHKRALYKYGQILYKRNNENNKSKGIKFIQQAAFKKYKKAIKFCIAHKISFQEDKNDSILEDEKEEEETNDINKQKEVINGLSNLENENNFKDSKSIKSENENDDSIEIENDEKNSNVDNGNEDESLSDIIGFW